MNVTIARYAVGIASLAIVCVSLVLAAIAVRRRFFSEWTGALARLAEILIGLAVLIAVLEVLGTIGLFRLGPIVAVCVVVGLASAKELIKGPRRPGPAAPRPRVKATGLALLAAGAVVAVWASPMLQSYDIGIHTFDSLWYHMPWATSFAQTGRVTPLHPDLEFLLAFYPATAELFHGLGIVLLARDTLSPALNLLWLGLALLAAWCIGRPKGREPVAVLGAALILATPMMDFSQPGSADGDVVGIFFLLAAAALILNSGGRKPAYVLAGISAGFAISIKLTFLAPVLALTIGVILTAPGTRRRSMAVLWLVPLLVAGGFWYVRNLIAVGNPLPWSSFAGILPTPAPPLQQHVIFSVAHYLTNSGFWGHFFVTGMASQLGGWWYVIAAGGIVGPLICVLAGSDRTVRMLALVALAGLAAYLVTPNSAMGPQGDPVGFSFNLRYAGPELALAFAILPLAPALDGTRRQAALVLAEAVALLATVAQASLWPTQHAAAAVAIGLGVVLLASIALFAWTRAAGAGPRRPRALPAHALLLASIAILLTAGAAAGYPWQRHYLRGRYAYRPGISHLSSVWDLFRKVHRARVGLAGTYGEFFSYPLLGLDDSNHVEYIAHHGPHGSFTPIATCREWRTAVNRGHFRYLVTTPERDFWRPSRLRPAPEGAWTASDPAARLVLRRHATGQPIDVFELRGRLNPDGCGQ